MNPLFFNWELVISHYPRPMSHYLLAEEFCGVYTRIWYHYSSPK
jgi:hypothetical protein